MENMNKLYCKSNDKMIYEVKIGSKYDDFMELNLSLVCGWDYINPDENDIQGYVSASNFIEDVQDNYCSCYFCEESVKECLTDNGYEIIENLPKIN